jgi:hypothetical protein
MMKIVVFCKEGERFAKVIAFEKVEFRGRKVKKCKKMQHETGEGGFISG